jgi:hypothetical protein
MRRIPTDKAILEAIWSRHHRGYEQVSQGEAIEGIDNKIYYPVDLKSVALDLKADGNIIFGRLHYYLDEKHGYKRQHDGSEVHLFTLRFGQPAGAHWINFPLLASVLASLQDDDRRHRGARWLSILSLCVSAAALALSLFATFWLRQPGR